MDFCENSPMSTTPLFGEVRGHAKFHELLRYLSKQDMTERVTHFYYKQLLKSLEKQQILLIIRVIEIVIAVACMSIA